MALRKTGLPSRSFHGWRELLTKALGRGYQEVSGEGGYTNFFAGGTRNLLSDRGFVIATVRYSF